jgi:hypothetical protein
MDHFHQVFIVGDKFFAWVVIVGASITLLEQIAPDWKRSRFHGA